MSVTVKPLQWREARISDRWRRETADSILGQYEAVEWSDGSFGGSVPSEDRDEPNEEFTALSLEAAKATCQADYEQRILSALDL